MFKALLRSMITIACLVVLIALSIIGIWQRDRVEAKQIELLKEQENNAGECISSGTSTDSEITGPWAKYAFAFNDPSNLLTLDDDEWLPEESQKGGTLLSYLGSDPKGLNFLTQNGSDVSNLQNYNVLCLDWNI